MAFHPYLMFEVGKSREAFARYQEIFGGELQFITGADAPADETTPGLDPDTVLHAALMLDDDLLMASEDPTGAQKAQGYWVSRTVADTAEANRVFDALAQGGEIVQAIIETFFSPAFGMCIDRFGIPWMVSTDAPES